MQPTPPGWPRLTAALFYEDPRVAIDWLCRAFGFTKRLVVDGKDGRIEHSELEFGEALLMVGGAGKAYPERAGTWKARCSSPRMLGGAMTANLCLFVDDVDAHCAHARQHGAVICQEPVTTDYGEDYWTDRCYGAIDPEGHVWWFLQRLRTGAAERQARGG